MRKNDMGRFVLCEDMECRSLPGYIPVEQLSRAAMENRRGTNLNVSGAFQNVKLWSMDNRALNYFGLSRERYLVQEVQRLKMELEEALCENAALQIRADILTGEER